MKTSPICWMLLQAAWSSGTTRWTMRTGTMPNQRDIVLVPVQFADPSSTRRRPVIINSKDEYYQTTNDVIAVAMTSNPTATTYSFTITSADLESGRLNHPGRVRVDPHALPAHRR